MIIEQKRKSKWQLMIMNSLRQRTTEGAIIIESLIREGERRGIYANQDKKK